MNDKCPNFSWRLAMCTISSSIPSEVRILLPASTSRLVILLVLHWFTGERPVNAKSSLCQCACWCGTMEHSLDTDVT